MKHIVTSNHVTCDGGNPYEIEWYDKFPDEPEERTVPKRFVMRVAAWGKYKDLEFDTLEEAFEHHTSMHKE